MHRMLTIDRIETVTATVYEIDPSIQTPEDLRSNATLAAEADKLYETTQSGPRTLLPCSISYVPFSHFTPPATLAALANRAPRSTLGKKSSPIACCHHHKSHT
jgi:hypothetical protein